MNIIFHVSASVMLLNPCLSSSDGLSSNVRSFSNFHPQYLNSSSSSNSSSPNNPDNDNEDSGPSSRSSTSNNNNNTDATYTVLIIGLVCLTCVFLSAIILRLRRCKQRKLQLQASMISPDQNKNKLHKKTNKNENNTENSSHTGHIARILHNMALTPSGGRTGSLNVYDADARMLEVEPDMSNLAMDREYSSSLMNANISNNLSDADASASPVTEAVTPEAHESPESAVAEIVSESDALESETLHASGSRAPRLTKLMQSFKRNVGARFEQLGHMTQQIGGRSRNGNQNDSIARDIKSLNAYERANNGLVRSIDDDGDFVAIIT